MERMQARVAERLQPERLARYLEIRDAVRAAVRLASSGDLDAADLAAAMTRRVAGEVGTIVAGPEREDSARALDRLPVLERLPRDSPKHCSSGGPGAVRADATNTKRPAPQKDAGRQRD